mgnify:CR=1 FL=1
MKLTRVVNTEGFKTYAKDKVERVTHKGKTYIVSRYINYKGTNVLDLRKQKIVNAMLKEGRELAEISKVIGVDVRTISSFLSMQFKQENMREGQANSKSTNYKRKRVKVICYTDNSIAVYTSVTSASKDIGCSGSNISNYCRSGRKYKHKANGKEYRMAFIED